MSIHAACTRATLSPLPAKSAHTILLEIASRSEMSYGAGHPEVFEEWLPWGVSRMDGKRDYSPCIPRRRKYRSSTVLRNTQYAVQYADIQNDGQSAARSSIWQKGVGLAGHEETLDERHGERSFPAHPVGGNAPALCWRQVSFDCRWFVAAGSDEAEAEHAQSVEVGLARLRKRTEHEVELNSVRTRGCVNEYASMDDEQLCNVSVAMVDRSAEGCYLLSFVPFP